MPGADIISIAAVNPSAEPPGSVFAPARAPRVSLFDRWHHCAAIDGCGDCGATDQEIPYCQDPRCPFRERA